MQGEPLQLVALKGLGLQTAQPLPRSEESLCRQQAFVDLLCLRSAALLLDLDTTLCSCPVLPQPLGLPGYRLLLRLCGGPAWKSALCFHSDSSTLFSNVKVALWLLSEAVQSQKDRYTACLPVQRCSVKQHCCCAQHQDITQPHHKT